MVDIYFTLCIKVTPLLLVPRASELRLRGMGKWHYSYKTTAKNNKATVYILDMR